MKGHSFVDRAEHLYESNVDKVERLMPFNTRVRRIYRAILGALGIGITAFSAAALAKAFGDPFFGDSGIKLLGAEVNPASAVFWLIIGLLLLTTVLIGRNVLPTMATAIGSFLLGFGVVLLGIIRTPANIFAYTLGDAFITFVIALVILWCGMYSWEVHHNGENAQAPTQEQLPSETSALVKVGRNSHNG